MCFQHGQALLRLWSTSCMQLLWSLICEHSESNLCTRLKRGIWEQMVLRSLWWAKGALCRWVVIGLPGPSWLCQVAQDGCEMEEILLLEVLLRLSEKLRSYPAWLRLWQGCSHAHLLKEINFYLYDISNSLSSRYKFLFMQGKSTLFLERPLSKRWILVRCFTVLLGF